MKFIGRIFLLLVVCHSMVVGQSVFNKSEDYGIIYENDTLKMPFGGGFNTPQFNFCDLNGDEVEELIAYDRSTNEFMVFERQGNGFVANNDLAVLIPNMPEGWALWVDYDCDGDKDIFSNGEKGAMLFENTSNGGLAQWELIADPIYSEGSVGKINLIINSTDIPAIQDIDGDGDIDILVYNFAIGGFIRWHKNMSIENGGTCKGLEFVLVDKYWGEFEECDCQEYAFNFEDCPSSSGGRITHPGGKSLLLIDMDADGDLDYFGGHEQCNELYYLENYGTKDDALMQDFSDQVPNVSHPSHFHIFPAGYYLDIDDNGVRDLLIAPNFSEDVMFQSDLAHTNWLYLNEGENNEPDFQFVQNDFLQEQMLDLGSQSVPLFFDIDSDGDEDLLVAANGQKVENGKYVGAVHLLKNANGYFKAEANDYLNLSDLALHWPVIRLEDLNGDGRQDLLFSGMLYSDFTVHSYYIPGTGDPASPFNRAGLTSVNLPLGINDTPEFADVNKDGAKDLLVGRSNGALYYYEKRSGGEYELIAQDYLGIERDFTGVRAYLTVKVTDFDFDGKQDLLTCNNAGEILVYHDFINRQNTSIEVIKSTNDLTESIDTLRVKGLSRLDISVLGDEQILVAGTARGGLSIFANSKPPVIDNGEGIKVKVYPNPSREGGQVKILSTYNATLTVVSVDGKVMLENVDIERETEQTISFEGFDRGVYLLHFTSPRGSVVKKFVYWK